jgi:integrase
MPKVPSREKTILSEKQIDELLKYLSENNHKQDACLLALAISSGARISELLRFTIDIVDPNNTAFDGVFIETSKSIKTKGRGKKGDLKYKYIIKDIFMPYYNDWLIERQRVMDEHKKDHNAIFIKQNGDPAIVATIQGWLPRWEEFLKLPIYFHAFRHYFVTQLTRIGLSSDLIIEIVGWKSSEMYKTYNDLTGKDREWKELEKLKDHLKKE